MKKVAKKRPDKDKKYVFLQKYYRLKLPHLT